MVAATNMNMQEAIAEGKFREDLYYRLNSVPIAVPPLRNRGTDIYLLFRKFAVDFAEKYKMPSISLNDEARQLLLHYQWPGNVRQLKNITEQISVLEENREITKEVLQGYLPSQRDNLPAIAGLSSGDKSFSNEREILYQVLFDMKKDMNDLKKLVNDIIQSGSVDISHLSGSDLQTMQNVYSKSYADHDSPVVETSLSTSSSPSKIREQKDIQEVDVEESLSLEDAEKELIRKALEKNNNKRKYAAQDLNISERTLYRKIKEYGLE